MTGATASAADNTSLGIILGAVSLGLVGLMGIVMGTNCMRRSGALSFLGAVGIKTPGNSIGSLTAEQKAADAAGKKSILGRMGTAFTSLKAHSTKIVQFVDAMPVPDAVKSFVHDPKSVLPKSARDMLETADNILDQANEQSDLESAKPQLKPLATKTITTLPTSEMPKGTSIYRTASTNESAKRSVPSGQTSDMIRPAGFVSRVGTNNTRVSVAPLPTLNDDVVMDTPWTDGPRRDYQSLSEAPIVDGEIQLRPVASQRLVENEHSDVQKNGWLPPILPRLPSSPATAPAPAPASAPSIPEGCKCEACLAAKAAHAPPPPPPSISSEDVMKQFDDLKKFMMEQMKPIVPPVVKSEQPALSVGNTEPVTEAKTEPVTEAKTEPEPKPEPEPKTEPVKFVNQLDFAKMLESFQQVSPQSLPKPNPSKALLEVNIEELAEIQAILAERQKEHSVRS